MKKAIGGISLEKTFEELLSRESSVEDTLLRLWKRGIKYLKTKYSDNDTILEIMSEFYIKADKHLRESISEVVEARMSNFYRIINDSIDVVEEKNKTTEILDIDMTIFVDDQEDIFINRIERNPEMIHKFLKTLSEREEAVLRIKYEVFVEPKHLCCGYGYRKGIALEFPCKAEEVFNVTRFRILDIEKRGLRKLGRVSWGGRSLKPFSVVGESSIGAKIINTLALVRSERDAIAKYEKFLKKQNKGGEI